jgi:hypothetical protein
MCGQPCPAVSRHPLHSARSPDSASGPAAPPRCPRRAAQPGQRPCSRQQRPRRLAARAMGRPQPRQPPPRRPPRGSPHAPTEAPRARLWALVAPTARPAGREARPGSSTWQTPTHKRAGADCRVQSARSGAERAHCTVRRERPRSLHPGASGLPHLHAGHEKCVDAGNTAVRRASGAAVRLDRAAAPHALRAHRAMRATLRNRKQHDEVVNEARAESMRCNPATRRFPAGERRPERAPGPRPAGSCPR